MSGTSIIAKISMSLSRVEFPTVINWTCPFPFLGLLGGVFHCYSNLDRAIYKQTVETLIRRLVLRHLIWVCTVRLFTTKRMLAIIWVKRKNPYICRNSELFYT